MTPQTSGANDNKDFILTHTTRLLSQVGWGYYSLTFPVYLRPVFPIVQKYVLLSKPAPKLPCTYIITQLTFPLKLKSKDIP